MEDKHIVAVVGIGAVTAIGCTCIAMGQDGVLVGTLCTLIGTIIGFVFGKGTTKNGE